LIYRPTPNKVLTYHLTKYLLTELPEQGIIKEPKHVSRQNNRNTTPVKGSSRYSYQ
jgi:hypothetical protein